MLKKDYKKIQKVSIGLKPEQITAFKNTFDAYDQDNSGTISANELKSCLIKLGKKPNELDIKLWMKKFDSNKDGTIDFAEFLDVMSKQAKQENIREQMIQKAYENLNDEEIESLKKIFRRYDVDGSGTIDNKELNSMIKDLGMTLTLTKLMSIIEKADQDKNGVLSYAEFVTVASELMQRRNIREKDMKYAHEFLSSDDINNLRNIFNEFDIEKRTKIRQSDILGVLSHVIDIADKDRINKVINNFRFNEEKLVTSEEIIMICGRILYNKNKRLLDACEGLTKKQIDQLKEGFAVYDIQKNGRVTIKEIAIVLKNMNQPKSLSELNSIMKSFNADKNNNIIDLPLFINTMAKPMLEANKNKKRYEDATKDLSEDDITFFKKYI